MNHNIYTVGVLPSQPWNYLGKKDLSDILTDFFFFAFIQNIGNTTNINNLRLWKLCYSNSSIKTIRKIRPIYPESKPGSLEVPRSNRFVKYCIQRPTHPGRARLQNVPQFKRMHTRSWLARESQIYLFTKLFFGACITTPYKLRFFRMQIRKQTVPD